MLFNYINTSLSIFQTKECKEEAVKIVLLCNKCQNDSSKSCQCKTAVTERLYSMDEVACHCEPTSCWVVVENVVYDLTEFLDQHPGGFDILLEHAGMDCTGVFKDVGHSKWAAKLLSKYRLGLLRPEDRLPSF